MVVVLTVAMVYEVSARYLFSAPTLWAFEISYMLMGSVFMLSMAYCLQVDQHVRVDFLYAAVRPRKRASIDFIGFLIVLPMTFWLLGGFCEYFERAYLGNEGSGESAWNPPIWPFRFVFILGFVLLLLQVTVNMVRATSTLVRGTDENPEEESNS